MIISPQPMLDLIPKHLTPLETWSAEQEQALTGRGDHDVSFDWRTVYRGLFLRLLLDGDEPYGFAFMSFNNYLARHIEFGHVFKVKRLCPGEMKLPFVYMVTRA